MTANIRPTDTFKTHDQRFVVACFGDIFVLFNDFRGKSSVDSTFLHGCLQHWRDELWSFSRLFTSLKKRAPIKDHVSRGITAAEVNMSDGRLANELGGRHHEKQTDSV